jgi:hypothetical protein
MQNLKCKQENDEGFNSAEPYIKNWGISHWILQQMFLNKRLPTKITIHYNKTLSQVKVILRPTVSRPVRLGVRHPSGTSDQFFPSSLWLFFRQFRVCWCVAPSLRRSRVCTFQFLPVVASAAFLRSESHETIELSLLSVILRLAQPVELGSCIYFPQDQGSPVIPAGFEFKTLSVLYKTFYVKFTSVHLAIAEVYLIVNLARNVKLSLAMSIFIYLFFHFSSAVNILFVYLHICLFISLYFCLVSYYCEGLARLQFLALSLT